MAASAELALLVKPFQSATAKDKSSNISRHQARVSDFSCMCFRSLQSCILSCRFEHADTPVTFPIQPLGMNFSFSGHHNPLPAWYIQFFCGIGAQQADGRRRTFPGLVTSEGHSAADIAVATLQMLEMGQASLGADDLQPAEDLSLACDRHATR